MAQSAALSVSSPRRIALPAGLGAAIIGLVVVPALLRFATLEVQSFDYDELYTVWLVDMGLGDMLEHIPGSESTPPLYYVVAWGWARLVGSGEFGLRALSALIGTATVPVAYAAARELVSRRAAVIAAGLVAFSPWLVWYSQEARSYILVVFLSALSFLLFTRSLRGWAKRDLALWALTSGLALAAHYFAIFLVAPEAVWLFAAAARRRPVALAVAAVAAVGLALLPLALHQRSQGHGDVMIAQSGSLALRVAQVPKQSLVGYDAPAEGAAALAAAALAAAGLFLLARRGLKEERHGALVAGGIGGAAIAVPVGLALAGFDYVVARNLIVAEVPLVIAVAVGFGAKRAGALGLAGAGALCILFVGVVVAVAVEDRYQRDDWRGAARALGPPSVARAVVLTPPSAPEPFRAYLPGLTRLSPVGARVGEVALVGIATTQGRPGGDRRVPRPTAVRPPAPGFRFVERRQGATFTVIRFRAGRPVEVTPRDLWQSGLGRGPRPTVLLQPAGGSR
jgi:mannosyltransferase